jgi:hypothetical protein
MGQLVLQLRHDMCLLHALDLGKLHTVENSATFSLIADYVVYCCSLSLSLVCR